jgi:FixJ family two-component response regulator
LAKTPIIAIIDDDESFRRATVSFVRSLGYVAAAFASADAFLRSDRVHDVDCLITDVQMPGMTGIELQTKLAAEGHCLPTIFVTAFPETKARTRVAADRTVGFLDKPFTEESLIACLNLALSKRQAG